MAPSFVTAQATGAAEYFVSLAYPFTSNVAWGLVVPIPTETPGEIRMTSLAEVAFVFVVLKRM